MYVLMPTQELSAIKLLKALYQSPLFLLLLYDMLIHQLGRPGCSATRWWWWLWLYLGQVFYGLHGTNRHTRVERWNHIFLRSTHIVEQ